MVIKRETAVISRQRQRGGNGGWPLDDPGDQAHPPVHQWSQKKQAGARMTGNWDVEMLSTSPRKRETTLSDLPICTRILIWNIIIKTKSQNWWLHFWRWWIDLVLKKFELIYFDFTLILKIYFLRIYVFWLEGLLRVKIFCPPPGVM